MEQGPGGDHDKEYICQFPALQADRLGILLKVMIRAMLGEIGGKDDGLEQGTPAQDGPEA
jgi:hypothetical protein